MSSWSITCGIRLMVGALITWLAPCGMPPWWTICTVTAVSRACIAAQKAWTLSTNCGSRKKPVVAAPTPVGSKPGIRVFRTWVLSEPTHATPASARCSK